MKIEQLRQLLEVSRTHSINRAAINLYISQPSLSQSLQALEEELGCQLVERSNRGARLTVEGEKFAEYAESVLAQFDRLKDVCKPFDGANVPTLSLASMRFRFTVTMAANLYNQHKAAPIRLRIHEKDRDSVLNLVSKGECEIGIISFMTCYKKELLKQFRAKDVQYYRLMTRPSTVMVGINSPLYQLPEGTKLTAEMLKPYPQIRYQKSDFVHFADKSEKLNLTSGAGEIIVDSRAVMVEMMEATNAYMVASCNDPVYARTSNYRNIRSYDLADESLTTELGWIKRSGSSPSALAMEYIQMVSDCPN